MTVFVIITFWSFCSSIWNINNVFSMFMSTSAFLTDNGHKNTNVKLKLGDWCRRHVFSLSVCKRGQLPSNFMVFLWKWNNEIWMHHRYMNINRNMLYVTNKPPQPFNWKTFSKKKLWLSNPFYKPRSNTSSMASGWGLIYIPLPALNGRAAPSRLYGEA